MSWSRLKEFIVKAIPTGTVDRKDLRYAGVAIPISLLYQGAFVAIFVYFFVTSYYNAVQTTFLSPIDADNTGQICETVPVTISSSYRIDANGYWEGQVGYRSRSAVYELEFIGAELSPSTYTAMTTSFKKSVMELKEKAQSREYAWNVMAWTSFSLKYEGNGDDGNKGTVNFYSTGSAESIYDQLVSSVGVTSSRGELCYKNGMSASYDYARAALTVKIPILSEKATDSLLASLVEPCADVFTIKDFGYSDNTNIDAAEIQFDVRSINTAVAVNAGIVSVDDLEQAVFFSSADIGEPIQSPNFIGLYKDSFYPEMAPILCYSLNATFWGANLTSLFNASMSGYTTCTVIAGNQFFYPIVEHTGRDFYDYKGNKGSPNTYSTWCWTQRDQCSPRNAPNDDDVYGESYYYSSAAEYYRDYKKKCEDQDMLVGLVFVSGYRDLSLLLFSKLQQIVRTDAAGDLALQRVAFRAMQTSVDTYTFAEYDLINFINGNDSTWSSYFNTSDGCPETYQDGLLAGFESLCGDWLTGCSMVTFRVQRNKRGVMQYIPDLVLNSDFLSIGNLSDSNTFFLEKPLDAMIANPPVSLVQDFLNCHLGVKNAVINAAGVSFSNATALIGAGVIVIFFVLQKVWNICISRRNRVKKLIDQDEKLDLYRRVLIAMFQAMRDGNTSSEQFADLIAGLKAFDMYPEEDVSMDVILEELRENNMIPETGEERREGEGHGERRKEQERRSGDEPEADPQHDVKNELCLMESSVSEKAAAVTQKAPPSVRPTTLPPIAKVYLSNSVSDAWHGDDHNGNIELSGDGHRLVSHQEHGEIPGDVESRTL